MAYELCVPDLPVVTCAAAPPCKKPAVPVPDFGGRTVTAVAGDTRRACAEPHPQERPVKSAPSLPPPWFERLMPGPKDDIGPRLQQDPVLKYQLQHPSLSVAFYEQLHAERLEKKKTGEEYRCRPFLVTLENMRRLTAHILADRHFEEPLTDKERAAFVVLEGYIRQMRVLGAPYKRTIKLAVLMTAVLEIVTVRHVIDDPDTRVPARLWEESRLSTFGFYGIRGAGDKKVLIDAGQMPLETVLSCRWGELNPAGVLDENRELFDFLCLGSALTDWLDNERLFLYPSFEPLDPGDFARFGHVPVYPLGMMTRYALNADGEMLTPLTFMEHDAGHTGSVGPWPQPGGKLMFDSIDSRLLFRTLVCDSLVAAGKAPGMVRAVELILFNLFHEWGAKTARWRLGFGSFLPLFYKIQQIRRLQALDYPGPWRQIRDPEALLACHWVHGVYHQQAALHGKPPEAGSLRGAQLLASFERDTAPVLRQHWSFFDSHRTALSEWFLSNARAHGLVRTGDAGHPCYGYASCNEHAQDIFHEGILVFRDDYHLGCRGAVEYLDVAWFEAVAHPEEYRRLAQALGDSPPAWPHGPSSSCPDPASR